MPKKKPAPAPPPPRKPAKKATKEETLAKAKAAVAKPPKPAAKARPGKPKPEPTAEPTAAPGPALAGPAGSVDVVEHETGLALALVAAPGHVVAPLTPSGPSAPRALVLLPLVRTEDRPLVELLVRCGYMPRFEEDFACWSAPSRAALWRRDDEGADTLGPLKFGHSDKGAGELVLVVDPFADTPESGDTLVWSASWTDGVGAAVAAAAGPDAPAAALAALFVPDASPATMPAGVGDGATSEDW